MTNRLRPRRSLGRSPWRLALLALLPVLQQTAVAKIAAGEWKHRQMFTLAAPGIVKLAIPTETFFLARPGFADLRVLDASGGEVPYLIDVAATPQSSSAIPASFRVQLRRLTTEIIVETGTVAPLESIRLASGARQFLKAAQIETSTDGNQWTLLADGEPLIRQTGSSEARLRLQNVSAKWLRITLDDERMPPVAFTGAELTLAAARAPEQVAVPIEIARRDEFVGETMLTLALPAPELPATEIELDVSDPLFSRQVTLAERQLSSDGESIERTLASAVLSRGNAGADHLKVELTGAPVARELQLHVANGSSAPLTIPTAQGSRKQVWLIFRAPIPGRYALLTGHTQAMAPAYDLAALAGELRETSETQVRIGPVEDNPGFQPPNALAGVSVLGANIDLGTWKFRKPVRVTTPGVQQVELDFEVLAHAQRDFADLRLVRESHQIPYLLERTSLLRPFALSLENTSDPKQPRVSRWKLSLPASRLPVQRISLESSTALFSRSVQLFEEVKDPRGEVVRRPLSGAIQWNRSPDQSTNERSIELTVTPTTDVIFLETDNGDNLPIALSRARGACQVTRVFFPSEVAPVDLYYGEERAAAPRYDLSLVAGKLLREEKNPAQLGAGERVDGRDASGSALSVLSGGILLWVALALVVVVLLLVIARLLPKRPANSADK